MRTQNATWAESHGGKHVENRKDTWLATQVYLIEASTIKFLGSDSYGRISVRPPFPPRVLHSLSIVHMLSQLASLSFHQWTSEPAPRLPNTPSLIAILIAIIATVDLPPPPWPDCLPMRATCSLLACRSVVVKSLKLAPSLECVRRGGFRGQTSHLANFRSISPLRSACTLWFSLRDRRTTRAATARYLL